MKKYQKWFEFTSTEKEAKNLVNEYNSTATTWQKKRYPGHYTEYDMNSDNAKYIVWMSR